MTKEQRQEVEERTYLVMDTLDKTHTNSEYYKKKFSEMSDTEFLEIASKKYPYKFHISTMVIEPTVDDAEKALNILGKSLMETVLLPYYYVNKDGVPVNSKECIVGYIHVPKVQQMIVKKNKNAIDIDNRDMMNGRLNGNDKGAANTDREFEGLATLGLTNSMDELARFRADAMNKKNIGYNIIRTTGMISSKDLPNDIDDSLAKQLFNVYLIGSHINSNLINQGNYTMYTLRNKQKDISRV